ncbi:MAG: hypothetical protein ACLS6G_06775 [Christensenellales bacterium]
MRADIAEGKSGSLVGWLEGRILHRLSAVRWRTGPSWRCAPRRRGGRAEDAGRHHLAGDVIASLTMLGVSWLILANMKPRLNR